ncbi:hypothetical protein AJ80_05300 [Polytolypa hystricis UAMH7299]|uniref:ubiquitinyl hydrolase 1 n=1 Tax=Polytolypa hystricis (strain UAMH7299) TaxID=1447883 RepID=A0A2B7Y4F1_POLH7|nr:hypothetical protein AJ80_05300 [Polytolypa hystricis UAMH7299]
MADRVKRRRLDSHHVDKVDEAPVFQSALLDPLTEADKSRWNGFCEIESEPALFNVMLRDFGVKGVKVQEVVSLDEEMLAFLHKPIYGLIFLFRWKEDDPDKQEPSCPDGLWFANQTVNYACASVALLNIINNVEGVDLGEELQHFKEFTMPFTPALRGDAISNFEFVKRVHNSFARKMDVLTADLQLNNEATERKSKAKKRDQVFDESEAGFHFIAFVPALGKVWKFDGLERQPQSLGNCPDENWLDLAKPEIVSRMTEYEEDQIEFSILSVAKDPIIDLTANLAGNVKSLLAIDTVSDGTANSDPPDDATIYAPDLSLNLTLQALNDTIVSEDNMMSYRSATPDELAAHRERLVRQQAELRAAIKEEQQSRRADDEYAAARKHDYGPAVNTWVRLLARKGLVEILAESL